MEDCLIQATHTHFLASILVWSLTGRDGVAEGSTVGGYIGAIRVLFTWWKYPSISVGCNLVFRMQYVDMRLSVWDERYRRDNPRGCSLTKGREEDNEGNVIRAKQTLKVGRFLTKMVRLHMTKWVLKLHNCLAQLFSNQICFPCLVLNQIEVFTRKYGVRTELQTAQEIKLICNDQLTHHQAVWQ